VVGKLGDSVSPVTCTVRSAPTAIPRIASNDDPPRYVLNSMRSPSPLSFVMKPSQQPPLNVGRYDPSVVGKSSEYV
jgi:hypothetical protein